MFFQQIFFKQIIEKPITYFFMIFLYKNWFKIIISLILIVLTYHLINLSSESKQNKLNEAVLLQKQKEEQTRQLNMEKCRSLGEKKYQEEERNQSEGHYGVPEYTFNQKMNTCLYKNFYLEGNGYFQKYVIDLYTNKEILTYIKLSNKKEVTIPFDDYNTREAELFGNN